MTNIIWVEVDFYAGEPCPAFVAHNGVPFQFHRIVSRGDENFTAYYERPNTPEYDLHATDLQANEDEWLALCQPAKILRGGGIGSVDFHA